jgi:hypothetical protein
MSLETIISGGQTGADRAGWDVALELGLAIGGWVPRGRRAEDGEVPTRYGGLRETDTDVYRERTEKNVAEADATVVFSFGPPTGGSGMTAEWARRQGKPLLVLDLGGGDEDGTAGRLRDWLTREQVRVLNVAGPRASGEPRIGDAVARVLHRALGG